MGKMPLPLLPLLLLIRDVAVVLVVEEVDGGRSGGGAAMMGFRYFGKVGGKRIAFVDSQRDGFI